MASLPPRPLRVGASPLRAERPSLPSGVAARTRPGHRLVARQSVLPSLTHGCSNGRGRGTLHCRRVPACVGLGPITRPQTPAWACVGFGPTTLITPSSSALSSAGFGGGPTTRPQADTLAPLPSLSRSATSCIAASAQRIFRDPPIFGSCLHVHPPLRRLDSALCSPARSLPAKPT